MGMVPAASLALNVLGSSQLASSMLLMVISGWAFWNVATSASQSLRWAGCVLIGSQLTLMVVLAEGSAGAAAEEGAAGELAAPEGAAAEVGAAEVAAGADVATAGADVVAAEVAAPAADVVVAALLPLLLPHPAIATRLAVASRAVALR
ncbi:hypothetical protein acdb102_03000 [Acidothermaceae bacterium B102]|nr:hypothetical protein acdb102_03000 [Acidothermaceae bacterium B102]